MGLVGMQAASKTNDTAGDGTTTATILSAAIIAEGMKIVAAGTNPIQVCCSMRASKWDLHGVGGNLSWVKKLVLCSSL